MSTVGKGSHLVPARPHKDGPGLEHFLMKEQGAHAACAAHIACAQTLSQFQTQCVFGGSMALRHAPSFLYVRPHRSGVGVSVSLLQEGIGFMQPYYPNQLQRGSAGPGGWTRWEELDVVHCLSSCYKQILYHLSLVCVLSVFSDLESCTGFFPGNLTCPSALAPLMLYSILQHSLATQ